MAYPRRLLNDDESVTVDLHPHWWFLAAPTATLVAVTAGGVATLVYTEAESTARAVASWSVIVALFASVAWLVVRYARWVTTNFVVTDRRIIFRTGVVAKHGIEIPLDRVNTVHYRQGLLERVVGAGDLLVESGGETGQQHFTDVRQPDRLQRTIHEVLQGRRAQGLAPAYDLADQLDRLDQLRERGALTDEEFDRQKRRLLDRGDV